MHHDASADAGSEGDSDKDVVSASGAESSLGEDEGVAVLLRWRIDCGEAGLVGRTVRIDGLGPAGIF